MIVNAKDKAYGRAALIEGEAGTEDILKRVRAVEEMVPDILKGANVKPSLLHGDLWIGNAPPFLVSCTFCWQIKSQL